METIVRDEYEWKYANWTTGGGEDENDEGLPPPKKEVVTLSHTSGVLR